MNKNLGEPIVLLSTTQQCADDIELRSSDFAAPGASAGSVRKSRLRGGKQEGVELVEVDNGALRMRIIPTRGMGILDVQGDGWRLGWDSPVREVVHPHFVNLHDRGGLGWLDGFNEWLVRCGLEYAGGPGLDRVVNNTGDISEMQLTLHGKIGNTPASHVEMTIDPQPPYTIRVVGIVHERTFHGPKLTLRSTLAITPGAAAFSLRDEVTNHSGMPQEFQLIYHVNYGPPLLEAGAQLVAVVDRIEPSNEHAARAIGSYADYLGPQPGFIEHLYLITPRADQQGQAHAMLVNARRDLAASMTWSVAELPCLSLWKNSAAIEDGYVTGIEPGTSFPSNRSKQRAEGRVPKLAPGETRGMTIEFAVHQGAAAVEARSTSIMQGATPR